MDGSQEYDEFASTLTVHYHGRSQVLAKDSEEAVEQARFTKTKLERLLKSSGAGGEHINADDDQSPASTRRNQFSYIDSGCQTLNPIMRNRGCVTEPPPMVEFSDSVTRSGIYDAYMSRVSGLGAAVAAAANTAGPSAAGAGHLDGGSPTNGGNQNGSSGGQGSGEGETAEGVDSGSVDATSLYTESMTRTITAMERMLYFNTGLEAAMDLRFFEDQADSLRLDRSGTLLPLWRFSEELARKKQATAVHWHPTVPDLFAVGYGSFRFNSSGGGMVCVYSLKNDKASEWACHTDSGVCCLDWHPVWQNMLVIGMYDGSVAIVDVTLDVKRPAVQSSIRTNKHYDPVWCVAWLDRVTHPSSMIAQDQKFVTKVVPSSHFLSRKGPEGPAGLAGSGAAATAATAASGTGAVAGSGASGETHGEANSSASGSSSNAAAASNTAGAPASGSSGQPPSTASVPSLTAESCSLSFYSFGGDGRVLVWRLVQNNRLESEHLRDMTRGTQIIDATGGDRPVNVSGGAGHAGGQPGGPGGAGSGHAQNLARNGLPGSTAAGSHDGSSEGAGDSSLMGRSASLTGNYSVTCVDFSPLGLRGDVSLLKSRSTSPSLASGRVLVGTEEGVVLTLSAAIGSEYVQVVRAHHMSIYAVKWNAFHPQCFATAGCDWLVKIWDSATPDAPSLIFEVKQAVADLCWSPVSGTIFGIVTADGLLSVYDLDVNRRERICGQKIVSRSRLTKLSFNSLLPVVIAGDDTGVCGVLKLSPNLRKIACGATAYTPESYLPTVALEVERVHKVLSIVATQKM